MATDPNFASTPVAGLAQISTANTNRDGTGTLGTVVTAGASGSRIEEIVIEATGTTTAGIVRLFLNDGTNTRLWREVAVTAATPSGTVLAFTASVRNDTRPDLPLLVLPTGWSLRAGTHNAETFNVFAFGGSF
jgi:hypothetical protein